MYKLLGFVLLIAYWTVMNALQTDEQRAMQALFEAKRAVNRAAHAAAQQLDSRKLAEGVPAIDPLRAEAAGLEYLRGNLQLDEAGEPRAGGFWREGADIALFEIIDETSSFPYTYSNEAFGFSATVTRPAVVMIVRVRYPRLFQILPPIEWSVKGVAELVY